jgi:hypothetical protein
MCDVCLAPSYAVLDAADKAKQRVVDKIMSRQTAASGVAVFVDPIILRAILDAELRIIP